MLLSGLASGSPEASAVYRVRPSEDLKSIFVQAELVEPGTSLRARDGDANKLRLLTDCSDRAVQHQGGRIPAGAANGCLRYRYPLEARSGRRSPAVADGVVVTSPSEWLWTPPIEDGATIRIELSMPEGMSASVPWQQIGPTSYDLGRSPGSATGSAVFGAIEVVDLELPDSRMKVALVDGPGTALDRRKVLDWLSVAGQDVAGVGGRFPNPEFQVIVQPVESRGRSPVPFGYVIRDGGEAVRFFVDPDRSLEDYLADWTATHEFSHLLLPYVRSREKWVSEGFASYYQNVLLARRGVYGEAEVWKRLHRSFRKAAEIRNPPRLMEVSERPFWEMRMLIYWSGAAMALMADTRLRELSDGRESLDSTLARMQTCCLPSAKVWRARDLFEQLDELTPHPVFMELYEEFNEQQGMPDLTALYRDLGLRVNGEDVELSSEGRLVQIRSAIMSR
jgi:hypothetical protein